MERVACSQKIAKMLFRITVELHQLKSNIETPHSLICLLHRISSDYCRTLDSFCTRQE